MRRVVSVWLRTLPTDRIRHQQQDASSPDKDTPRVTVAQDGNSRVLAATNAAAQQMGLRPGMKLIEARILVPGLTEHPADPAGDTAALLRLAEDCLRYAPLAAADTPDGLWIDVTGSTHLHGGEARMLRALLQRLADQGFAARAAIADTPGLAHAAARHASQPVSIVPPGAPMPVDFPLEALRLPPDICDALRRLGIRTTGQAASIARGPMARRFGKIIALRLDQAAGTVFEPIVPLAPPAAIQARQAFAEPLLTAEAFASVITRLTATVCTALERAGQGARRLDLLFERVDGSIQAIRAGSARPMRDAAHLGRMLADRLEKVDPGLGVEAMRLLVSAADTLGPEQVAASLFEAPAADLAPLIDRLTNRLGAARVYRVAPAESHMPERTLRRVPPLAAIDTTWPRAVPRPVRLLDPPQQIEALMDQPDDAPVAFTWRRVCHTVRRADGPERLGGEWWRDAADDDAQRDYFQVEDDTGRRFWLFRGKTPDAKSRWFLHGFM